VRTLSVGDVVFHDPEGGTFDENLATSRTDGVLVLPGDVASVDVLDARLPADLNRPPETCVYEEAWGQVVWCEPLGDAEKAASLEKHTAFYTVLGVLYEKLESLHPQMVSVARRNGIDLPGRNPFMPSP